MIDAAIESIYQNGYANTTVAKICDFAGGASGNLHHYFDSKEGLLVEAMARLLDRMRKKVLEGCKNADSPRGKLWAVIESVLGDEQSDKRASAVWLAFWVQADYHDDLRRIREVYKKRLLTNVRGYLRQIFREIGAHSPDERAEYAASIIISLIHGVWLSHELDEEISLDMERARLLVWECLEMVISRSRERLREDRGLVATSTALLSGLSVEVITKDMKELDQWRDYAESGMQIFIPHFRDMDVVKNVEIAHTVIKAGYTPVPHVSARNVHDEDELERIVSGMAGVGVRDFLFLGGGENPPVGKFDSALQMLKTGVLSRHKASSIAFAGHPEEHPEQERSVMRRALKEKIALAYEMGLKPSIVTQFCFAATPFFDFLDWLKSADISVPVRLGVAGRVDAGKLIKFAAACGIGRSLRFVRLQFGKSLRLAKYSPEGLLAEFAGRIAVRRYDFPVQIHFYPFGAVRETLAVAFESSREISSDEFVQTTHH